LFVVVVVVVANKTKNTFFVVIVIVVVGIKTKSTQEKKTTNNSYLLFGSLAQVQGSSVLNHYSLFAIVPVVVVFVVVVCDRSFATWKTSRQGLFQLLLYESPPACLNCFTQ
jgi:hypothetical protein